MTLLEDIARAICASVDDPVNPSMVRYWEPQARAAAAVVAKRLQAAGPHGGRPHGCPWCALIDELEGKR